MIAKSKRKIVYVIVDWAGNRIFPDKEFKTFQDGWDYIYRKFPNGEHAEWDDLFVENKSNIN